MLIDVTMNLIKLRRSVFLLLNFDELRGKEVKALINYLFFGYAYVILIKNILTESRIIFNVNQITFISIST